MQDLAPELITERFTLRPLRESDASDIQKACQDPEIVRWCVSVPQNYTYQDALEYIFFTHIAAERGSEWVWAIDRSGIFCGIISLFDLTGATANIGFWMTPNARRQGLLLEAARVVLGFSFDPLGLGLDSITWTATDGNIASEAVAQKLGFSHIRSVPGGTRGRPDDQGNPTALDARVATMTRQEFAFLGMNQKINPIHPLPRP